MTLASMASQIDESLNIGSDFDSPSSAQPYSLMAFQHFMKWSMGAVGLPAIRAVMETDMLQVAFSVSLSIVWKCHCPLLKQQYRLLICYTRSWESACFI